MEKPRNKPRLERATSAAAAPPMPAAIKVIKQLPKYVNPYAQPKATGTVATWKGTPFTVVHGNGKDATTVGVVTVAAPLNLSLGQYAVS